MDRITKTLATLIVAILLSGLVSAGAAQASAAEKPDQAAADELVTTARTLLEEIRADRAELQKLRQQLEQAEGEERLLIRRRLTRLGLETLQKVGRLVDNVVEQEAQGLDASEFRSAAQELVGQLAAVARRRVDELQKELAGLRNQRESTSGEQLLKLEQQLTEANELLNLLLAAVLDNADRMERLGLPADGERAYVSEILEGRAELSAERVALSVEQIASLKERLKDKPDDPELSAELAAVEAKRDVSQANLTATIKMMDRLGLETAEYQKLLIEATGEITTDILDTEVAIGLFQKWLNGLRTWIADNGIRVIFKGLVFLLILLFFRALSRLTRRVVIRAVSTSRLNLSQLMQKMFVSVSGNVVMAIGLLVALSQLGFSMGPILAGLGIAGFILGFALQETLGNFASGMMILIYRPFDVGDMIDAAGAFGKVSAMSMVSTTILTIDNQTLIIPNGKIWGDVIKNVTGQTMRRVDMVFGVSYSADIPHTERVLAAIVSEHPKVLADPAPTIKLHTLGESSVDFVVRPWVKTDDYWEVYWDVTREVKMRFDREGIGIPFPQRDVHIYEERRQPTSPGNALPER